MSTLPVSAERHPSSPALGPWRYALVATVARGCVEAAFITFVLVGDERGVSSFSLGVLAACAAGPQVLTAPWLGARLDGARRPARTVAGLVVVIAVGIALIGGGLGRAPFALVVVVAVIWSLAEPAVMGGLSGLASRSSDGRGRIETADAVSYGVAAIAGQGLVAVLFAVWSPPVVVAVLAIAGGAAALAVSTLPVIGADELASDRDTTPSMRAGLAAILGDPQLRQVTILTTISMSAFGGLALAAVSLAEHVGRSRDDGPILVLAMAIGAVPGALSARRIGATARPVTASFVAVAVVGLAFAAATASWEMAIVAFAVAGFADGPLLAATFAVRTARTPASLRASVYTIAAGAKVAGTAVGALTVGAVADRDGRAGVLCMAALQAVAIALAAWSGRGARRVLGSPVSIR